MNAASFYALVQSRKSIRKFKPELPAKEIIERIIAAGTHAPSGKNRQNWHFFVVSGQKRNDYLKLSQKSWLGIKDVLKKKLKPSLYDFTERFFFTLGEAPVIIFCYCEKSPIERDLTSIGSVYMAVQNMNLACLAEGLGCCTMGAPLEIKDEVDRFLNVPTGLDLLCAVAMGYPDHNPPKAARAENRTTWLEPSGWNS